MVIGLLLMLIAATGVVLGLAVSIYLVVSRMEGRRVAADSAADDAPGIGSDSGSGERDEAIVLFEVQVIEARPRAESSFYIVLSRQSVLPPAGSSDAALRDLASAYAADAPDVPAGFADLREAAESVDDLVRAALIGSPAEGVIAIINVPAKLIDPVSDLLEETVPLRTDGLVKRTATILRAAGVVRGLASGELRLDSAAAGILARRELSAVISDIVANELNPAPR
ncbi:hypothetical protein [Flindersiella endophytica]